MRRHRAVNTVRAIAIGMIAAALASACSLLVDTADLENGSPTNADGGGNASDGSASPDALDGSNGNDVVNNGDAVTTSDVTVPMDASGPCEADLCDDFDVGDLGEKWMRSGLIRGKLTLEADGLSAPNALRAVTIAGAGSGYAELVHSVGGVPATVHCELDMKLDAAPATQEIEYLKFQTVGGSSAYATYLLSENGAWLFGQFIRFEDGGSFGRTTPMPQFPIGQWVHVAMDLTNLKYTFSYNGFTGTLANSAPEVGTSHEVHVGLTYVEAQASSVLVDNVACNHHL